MWPVGSDLCAHYHYSFSVWVVLCIKPEHNDGRYTNCDPEKLSQVFVTEEIDKVVTKNVWGRVFWLIWLTEPPQKSEHCSSLCS